MGVRETFDEWAEAGKDRGMETRHWHTAKHALARMPIEDGDRVLDLGTGSGYALRALSERGAGPGVGIDASPAMLRNARSYTEDASIDFCRADFQRLPFAADSVDHSFSMEAFYYAERPAQVLEELVRVLRPGGTFYCAVDYYEENHYAHDWDDVVETDLTLWSREDYRTAFRKAGFHVGEQDNLPDREVDIPPAAEFPYQASDSTTFETREEMVERYRELGTLLTVGVVP